MSQIFGLAEGGPSTVRLIVAVEVVSPCDGGISNRAMGQDGPIKLRTATLNEVSRVQLDGDARTHAVDEEIEVVA